ncbi:MAG: YraN family protein [Rikenellaceae bacterium]|nr:YraN family protein [Rikenellaceae bacterium]
MDRETIGRLGEDAAADWLEGHGYAVLERNWRYGRYEIDIIAERDGELHIVEVKCRAADGLTRPEEAVTPAKFSALRRAAEEYISQRGVDADTRFDLVSVTHSGGKFEVKFVPEAMLPEW